MIEPTGSWDVYHVGPHNGELRWPKPVAFDTVILRFAPVSTWYALEYWDGQQYRLLAEDRKNALEVRAHQFPAVEGTRLRIQLVEPWTPTKGMSRIEVYNLAHV
jgi:hypothetical protein